MRLFVDDVREPWRLGFFHYWARTYEEAVKYLETGKITFASLDHDLGFPSCKACRMIAGSQEEYHKYLTEGCEHGEKTGYDICVFLEANPHLWPMDGVAVHSANPVGKQRMLQVIQNHYGRTF